MPPPVPSSSSREQLATEVGAYEADRLQALADQGKTVYTVKHDHLHDPWPVARLQPLLERLAKRVTTGFADDVDDFTVRKTCLHEDAEVLAFQRDHPKLYYIVTDRKLVREARFREAVTGLLHVRGKVEAGEVADGNDADAMATRSVLAALGSGHIRDA